MAVKKKTATKVAKEEPKKQLISLEILNTEVLNFIMTVVILALLVFYVVPSNSTNVAPIDLENNCKTIFEIVETPGVEFSHVDEKGSCFFTQDQPFYDMKNNKTLTAKIVREFGVVSSITTTDGIEQQQQMMIPQQ